MKPCRRSPTAAHRSPLHLATAIILLCLSLFACRSSKDLDAIAAEHPAGSARGVVEALASIEPPRNAEHPESLERAARFIAGRMRAAGLDAKLQPFTVNSTQYYNVSALIGSGDRKRIVVGAHYDVAGDTPGADDNASGVAALLYVADKLARQTLPVDVELVAYSLEESGLKGSAQHAQTLADAGIDVIAMMSLEMLGYYTDAPDSQKYPEPGLARYFPTTGNFLAVLALSEDAAILERIRGTMNAATDLRVFALSGPPEFRDLARSDHASYWPHGIPAVMVTDTANFRNPHYHKQSDRPETLDYDRLRKAADAVYAAIIDLAQKNGRE